MSSLGYQHLLKTFWGGHWHFAANVYTLRFHRQKGNRPCDQSEKIRSQANFHQTKVLQKLHSVFHSLDEYERCYVLCTFWRTNIRQHYVHNENSSTNTEYEKFSVFQRAPIGDLVFSIARSSTTPFVVFIPTIVFCCHANILQIDLSLPLFVLPHPEKLSNHIFAWWC